MNKRGGFAIAIILIATGALRWMSPGGSSSIGPIPETPKSESSQHAKERSQHPHPSLGAGADELGDTIQAFFGLDRQILLAADNTKTNPAAPADLKDIIDHWNVPKSDRPKVRFLIALAPDPLHTQLSLFFDRGMETIQQAAQEQGYDFDRATMPWDPAEHPESNDFQKREAEAADNAEREALPGLLIFRPQLKNGQRAERGPLFVFVVGETPTAGIHKNQFANALQIMCEIHGNCPPQSERPAPVAAPRTSFDPAPVLILGPASSGSLYSLQVNLDLNRSLIGDHWVFVFSGTARGTAQRCWFQGQEGANFRFLSFQEGEDRVVRKFLQFTKDRGYLPEDTAILSEDETSYGYTDVSPPSSQLPDPDPSCELGYGSDDRRLMKLQFPRGISHFRAAYQKHIGAASSGDASSGRAVLPLDLQATGNEDDSVPAYAKVQFPLSQEAVMLGIVARLNRSHPKFVVLRASDAVDQLFLTRYLRQNYPQGRVVVTAPDLLYAREDDGLLHGVLGISAYSLVPEAYRHLARPKKNKDEENRQRSQRAFPGSSDQGIFNAMVSLLAIDQNPPAAGALFDTAGHPDLTDLPYAHYSSYGSFQDWRVDGPASPTDPCTDCQLAPGLWISLLAHDGYWMAAAIPRDESSSLHQIDRDPEVMDRNRGPHTPKSWVFAYSTVVFLLFVHCYLVCMGSIFAGSEIRAHFGSIEDPTCVRDPKNPASKDLLKHRLRRARLLAWGTASLASIAVLLVGTRYAGVSPHDPRLTTILLLFLPLACTYAVSWNLYKNRGELRIAASLAAGITVLAASTFFDSFGPRYWLTSLTAYRAMHLTSGVSPVLPFLLLVAAVYVMSWYELQALSVTDGRRPRLPARKDLPADCFHVSEDDVEELRNVATSLSIPGRVFLPILCCLVPLTLLTLDFPHPHPIQTIEGESYDWLYFFFILLWLALFLGCLSRLISVWNECRRFLGGLDNLPLRTAFKCLQDFSWSLIWTSGGSALRDSFKNVSRELHSLEHLRNAMNARPIDGEDKIPDDLANELTQQLNLIHETRRSAQSQYRDAAKTHDPVPVLDRVRKLWKREDEPGPQNIAKLMKSFGELQEHLGNTAGLVMRKFLAPAWSKNVSPVASGVPADAVEKKTPSQLVAEEFVSLLYANFLATVMLRIRTLVLEATGIFLFLLFSISCYPFEPNPDMFTLAVFLLLLMGVVVAYVYSQMHRDAALSRLTSTAEGELGIQFWGQFLAAGAIPVLSLLAVQFPSISRMLTNLLGPALQAIK